tara:strand:+ start:421 stop:960 length:540 start_codon:yes stop_codon:yes gene_type:complete
MLLVTFDIDGTMEFGDPVGVVTKEVVQFYRDNGVLVGSASDRTKSTQLNMWNSFGFQVDFAIVKHKIPELMEEYTQCKSFWHVGDRPVDQQIASNAGFTFFWPDQVPDIGFVNEVFTDGSFASSKQKNYKELFSDPEALGRLAMQALSKERKQEDISKYDEYASSGRVDGDDLGNVLPI